MKGDLVSMLAEDLARPSVKAWLGATERAALDGEEMPASAVLAGRLLRSGDVRGSARAGLRSWLAARSNELATAAKAIHDRDDAESLLVAIGTAVLGGADALVRVESDLVKALAAIDARTNAEEIQSKVSTPWLTRIARLEPESSWLDGVFMNELAASSDLARRIESRREAADAAPPSIPAFRLPRRAVGQQMSAMLGANEPGGVDAILEKPLVVPIARLCDGDVEVYAHGLGEDEEGPPGFVVRHARDFDAIEAVELDPPAPEAPLRSKLDLAFWVPLAGASSAPRKLVVRVRRDGEAIVDELPIELD